MVGAYQCSSEETETNGFRDPSTYSTTSNCGHFIMHTLCLTSAILTRLGTVRRVKNVTHCLFRYKTIKAIKRLHYDHHTPDLYGGEILSFDRLSIFQDMLACC
jgi:hypothetical protein